METINFMGDLIIGDQPVIFGCGFDSWWKDSHYREIFQGVKPVLMKAVYNIANFEAVVKNRETKCHVDNWAMCCDENIYSVLAENKINIVSVANNHTYDYGKDAFDKMIAGFESHNIKVIGLREKPWITIEVNQKKIAIIAASYLSVYSNDTLPYFHNPTKKEWKKVIDEIGQVDKIVAYVHWGSEFIENPSKKQRELAEEILSAGVDDIIGHHPHILQTNEKREGHHILFSLGNFCSDYWQKRLRKTTIIELDTENMKYGQHKCFISKKGIPCLVDGRTDILYNHQVKKNSLFFSRMRMRIEYLLKVILVFPRIQEKRVFLAWLKERMSYVLKNMFKEIKDPNLIYKNYRR